MNESAPIIVFSVYVRLKDPISCRLSQKSFLWVFQKYFSETKTITCALITPWLKGLEYGWLTWGIWPGHKLQLRVCWALYKHKPPDYYLIHLCELDSMHTTFRTTLPWVRDWHSFCTQESDSGYYIWKILGYFSKDGEILLLCKPKFLVFSSTLASYKVVFSWILVAAPLAMTNNTFYAILEIFEILDLP